MPTTLSSHLIEWLTSCWCLHFAAFLLLTYALTTSLDIPRVSHTYSPFHIHLSLSRSEWSAIINELTSSNGNFFSSFSSFLTRYSTNDTTTSTATLHMSFSLRALLLFLSHILIQFYFNRASSSNKSSILFRNDFSLFSLFLSLLCLVFCSRSWKTWIY